MQQLKIWIAIKQSTNLELNETHTVPKEGMQVTGSKNSQKGVNSQVDYQTHIALDPPKVSSLQA